MLTCYSLGPISNLSRGDHMKLPYPESKNWTIYVMSVLPIQIGSNSLGFLSLWSFTFTVYHRTLTWQCEGLSLGPSTCQAHALPLTEPQPFPSILPTQNKKPDTAIQMLLALVCLYCKYGNGGVVEGRCHFVGTILTCIKMVEMS